MPKPNKLGIYKVMSVALGEMETALLDRLAKKEDRYLGEMIRIAIREAAERRGIKVEQPQVAQEA
jgi:hypothetical protein